MKAVFVLAGGILVALPVAWFLLNSRLCTETAPYMVVRTDGAFEVRDYPALTLATTTLATTTLATTTLATTTLATTTLATTTLATTTLATTTMDSAEGSQAFSQLFGFITGKNAKAEKIPMTTPVIINPGASQKTMSFVMPETFAQNGVPQPSGAEVRISKAEPARYVVLRYKGRTSKKDQQAAIAKLQGWLGSQNLTPESEPIFAYYDPPWTPVFLRRNEVMVRVAK